MGAFEIIIVILSIAWGIISLILFIKIWKMTDDVREINHNLYEIAKFLEESHNKKTE
ncbi:MAG: hypothetical protein IKX17_03860 [Prevotella sp.]|nr:hypothetical protein [Prevotella sp.]